MKRRPCRNHSPAFKASSAGSHLFRRSPNEITAWKSQREGSASEVFGSGGGTQVTPAVDVKSLHAKIGELTLENDS